MDVLALNECIESVMALLHFFTLSLTKITQNLSVCTEHVLMCSHINWGGSISDHRDFV